ncbi:hypothetical protein PInf_003335 [Phytophthora infestans]|nr:hypothetical protein PInf_003335 [Phytophthora infestans]
MSAELIAPALQEGDWLDVVDGDGIWNVAQVLRLPTPETVEVTYDCWGDEYNEELRRDSERIAPFHTRTWAVKCSQNLRLEGRLLVDFLDKVEFKERCRCWVEKSKVTAFQSDEEARNVLTKLKKKKNKSKGEVRLKNLALSTELLSMCDAREDFPEFVEGTLPVQFKKNYTRPTAAVREEMGEEIWKREFADNRVKHASTHAYLPLLRDGSNSDSGNLTEKTGSSPAKSGQTSHDRATSSSPGAGKDDASSVSKESKEPKDVTVAPENPEIPTQKPVNFRKRARSHEEEESSSSTDTKCHSLNIPNHARDAPCAKTDVADKHLLPTDQQETSAAAKKNATNESKDVEESTSPMKNLARLTKATVRADEQLQNIETALESKLTELAEKSAKAEELRNKCAALKTRVLSPPPAPASPTHIPQEELPHESSPTHSSTSISIREAQKVRKESTRREKNANGRPGDTRSPTLARRSSPAKCGIRGLELVLDDLLAKDLNQSLSAATTTAELDAIKAELLAFPEVRAAIARIQYPSYATATRGLPPRKASSLSGDNDRRVWEKAKSRFTKYAASTPSQSFEPKKLSPWSPSQQFVGSWGYQSDVELNTEHFQSPSSLLLDSLSPDQSSFGFSVNDNFSMNQWYQDLYPKTFGFQRPERCSHKPGLKHQNLYDHSSFAIVMADSTTRTLFACALDVLTTGDAFAKADKTTKYVAQWKSGEINVICNEEDDVNNVPDHPARPENVEVVPAYKAKQGSRKAFVHSWAHRLTELGSFYGDLAGHEGLWDAALETRDSILARLAVVHLVHEARGLDVFPNAVKRQRRYKFGNYHKNYNEETTHVGAGVRWFRYVCERDGMDPIAKFHEIVPQYYKGLLKPPFNKEARDEAGMLEEWYLPLSTEAVAAAEKQSTGGVTVDEASISTGVILAIVGGCIAVMVVICAVLLSRRRLRGKDEFTLQPSETIQYTDMTSPKGKSRGQTRLWDDDVITAKRISREEIQLRDLISRGGNGEVYAAVFHGRAVAVKMLLPATRAEIKHVNEFLAEAKMAATMDHPRVISLVGVAWNALSDLCVVFEYMDGGDLRTLLDKSSTGIDFQKATIAIHICHALTYLHSLMPSVIHRDLKSRNVLLSRKLDAKLTDFGISRERLDATMTAGVGTSLWMAPEVMMGERYDDKADIFSLGVLLSELDVHSIPYANVKTTMSDAVLLHQIVVGKIRVAFSQFSPREFWDLGHACTSVNPRDRPTAAEALYKLQMIL